MKNLLAKIINNFTKKSPAENRHILFIHIPKTAGTSFRTAARRYFGRRNTLFDYGSRPSTSKLLRKMIYEQKNFSTFSEYIKLRETLFLSGHVKVTKYMHLFESQNIITFVREPVAQIISHYTYRQKKHGIKTPLHEFIQEEKFRNIQSRYLNGKPLELFGFVGLTEEYETSLSIINHNFGTNIKSLKLNKTKKSKLLKENLDEETLALIRRYNQQDFELYENAKKIFALHKKVYEEKKLNEEAIT